jgi:hypothetical protein
MRVTVEAQAEPEWDESHEDPAARCLLAARVADKSRTVTQTVRSLSASKSSAGTKAVTTAKVTECDGARAFREANADTSNKRTDAPAHSQAFTVTPCSVPMAATHNCSSLRGLRMGRPVSRNRPKFLWKLDLEGRGRVCQVQFRF